MSDKEYCIRKLKEIYPNIEDSAIELMASLILVAIYTGEIEKVSKDGTEVKT